MDELRQRITEDLSGLFKGELRCDPLTVSMYSCDASLYEIAPLGVAYPKDQDDVAVLARYAAENGMPLVARGAGTGLAGGAVGSGLIVDFSRHMRRIEAIGSDTVRVQAGVVRDELNRVLKQHGRYFPPDPSNSAVTTVGGMLAVDAAGSHSIRIGSARDHVQHIEMILAGGHRLEARNESLDNLNTPLPVEHSSFSWPEMLAVGNNVPESIIGQTVVSRLANLLTDNAPTILERQPHLTRNCSGYYLRNVVSETHLHLPRLLVGSEGTLGLFTSATLHTAPLPRHRGVVLLLFGQLEAAIQTVQSILGEQPSACDLLDRRLLSLAREADERFERLISPSAEAALLVEQPGNSDREVRDRIRQVIDAVHNVNLRAVVASEAYTFEDVEFLWSLPTKVVPLLSRLKGQTRPLPFVEDIAVPVEALHEFLLRAQKVFQRHHVTASLYAHAASGQLHLRPFLPSPAPRDPQQLESIARDLYQVVFSVGGTMSGEHGDGLSRTAFVRSQYGPLYKVFQQVKAIFDPQNLMNPGKIVSDDQHVTVRNLRPPADPSPNIVDLHLQWKPQQLTDVAVACNGCGTCKTQSSLSRMCPFFRIDQIEEASPRAKANIVRDWVGDRLDPQALASPEMKRLADLCFNCKQCQLECPTNVDIPHMVIETRAAYVAANGLSRTDWLLSRVQYLAALGCTVSPVSNWALDNPTARWVMEKLLGIARQRKLPKFARRTFLRSLSRSATRKPKPETSPRQVVYFVDYFANYHDPQLARAFVSILRHNGIPVHVPPAQTVSGMALISAGDIEAARAVAEQNVRELGELAREGFQIVCTEPSAALCLKQEYPMLLDHPDVEQIANQTIEAGAFLQELETAGRLRKDFAPLPIEAGYHMPCHLKALDAESPLQKLLSLIPEFNVRTIEKGCSGMAGAYGLKKQNFRTSLRIGWGLINEIRKPEFTIGTTECSTCRMQMEQGTPKPTLHPLKLLALSYGLLPEIEKQLNPSKLKLVLT